MGRDHEDPGPRDPIRAELAEIQSGREPSFGYNIQFDVRQGTRAARPPHTFTQNSPRRGFQMAWPVDGRSRTAPTYSADAMSPQEFEDRLIETVVRARLNMDAGYGFPEELDQAQGRLYHGTFLAHFSFFAWKFPSWLLSVASQCPHQDVRREIIKDCVDEEVADPDADGMCHIDLLYEEAEACGLPREEVAALQPTPIVLACVHALENFSRTLGWETGYAALASLEIGATKQAVELKKKILSQEQIAANWSGRGAKSLSERTGLPPEKMRFAEHHAVKDQYHGGGELTLLVKHARTRDLQENMLWAAKASLDVFCTMRQEIDRVARAAVGLAPREAPDILSQLSK